jgi:hypothetical protein
VEVTWKDGWELGIKDKRVWVFVAFLKATYMTRSSVSLLYRCHLQSVKPSSSQAARTPHHWFHQLPLIAVDKSITIHPKF